jgi:hypothetical protein
MRRRRASTSCVRSGSASRPTHFALERALVADEGRFRAAAAKPNERLSHPGRWRVWVFHAAIPAPWPHQSGTTEATSAYDTNCLKATLEQLIDFDGINTRLMRLSVSAVSGHRLRFGYPPGVGESSPLSNTLWDLRI